MSIASRFGKLIRPLVNFPRWMGLAQVLANARAIVDLVKGFRSPPQGKIRQETFEEAMQRLNLTEKDVQERMRFSFWFSLFYTVCGIAFLVYAVYLMTHLSIGAIAALLISVLMFVLAYREHFWYFQMKTRTLGRTFKEWLAFLIRGAK